MLVRKRTLQILVALLLGQFGCASKNDTKQTVTRDVKSRCIDTVFNKYKIDTTLVFMSFEKMNKYRDSLELMRWKEKDSGRILNGKISDFDFKMDSIKYLNQDYYTYLIFKYLKSADKVKNNLFLVGFNTDFSTLISPKQRLDMFNLFPKSIRESEQGRSMAKKLHALQAISIDQNLDLHNSISFYKPEGSMVKLSSLIDSSHEKYLIIFGASWCGPCRYENQLLKKRISLIDTTKVKLIGVSIDEDASKWLKMIEKDASPWLTVRDAGGLKGGLAKALQIQGVPTNILLDKQHKILCIETNIEVILTTLGISKQ